MQLTFTAWTKYYRLCIIIIFCSVICLGPPTLAAQNFHLILFCFPRTVPLPSRRPEQWYRARSTGRNPNYPNLHIECWCWCGCVCLQCRTVWSITKNLKLEASSRSFLTSFLEACKTLLLLSNFSLGVISHLICCLSHPKHVGGVNLERAFHCQQYRNNMFVCVFYKKRRTSLSSTEYLRASDSALSLPLQHCML